MVFFTVSIAIIFQDKIGSFLSLLGALACTPIAYTIPTLFHYRLCSYTKWDKTKDILIMIISVIMTVFCSAYAIVNW
jgi:amino acid permease